MTYDPTKGNRESHCAAIRIGPRPVAARGIRMNRRAFAQVVGAGAAAATLPGWMRGQARDLDIIRAEIEKRSR